MSGVRRIGVALLFGFLLAPVLVVVPMSIRGGNLRAYAELRDVPGLGAVAVTSLILGIVVTVLALAIALPAALVLARRRFFGRMSILALLTAPLLLPSIALGLALVMVFLEADLVGRWPGLVLAHLAVTLPYALYVLLLAASGLPAAAEDAAASLGARPMRVFWRVTLPLLRPGMITAAAVVFLVSFEEPVVSLFVTGSRLSTLPVGLFRGIEANPTSPVAAAVSTLLLLLTLSVLLVLNRIVRR